MIKICQVSRRYIMLFMHRSWTFAIAGCHLLYLYQQGRKLEQKSGGSTFHSPSLPPPPSLPLEVGLDIAARGSGGVLKLPQRVRAEPTAKHFLVHFQPFV